MIGAPFHAAEVGTPLVPLRKDCAYILGKARNVTAKFQKRNGLRAAAVESQNPRYSGFKRLDQ